MLDPYLSLNTCINFMWNKELSVKNEIIKYCTKKINVLSELKRRNDEKNKI